MFVNIASNFPVDDLPEKSDVSWDARLMLCLRECMCKYIEQAQTSWYTLHFIFCNVHIYKDADDKHHYTEHRKRVDWKDRYPYLISVAGANERSHIHNLCTYIYISIYHYLSIDSFVLQRHVVQFLAYLHKPHIYIYTIYIEPF